MIHFLIIGSGVREAFIAKKLTEDSNYYNKYIKNNDIYTKNYDYTLKITCIGLNKNPIYVNYAVIYLLLAIILYKRLMIFIIVVIYLKVWIL